MTVFVVCLLRHLRSLNLTGSNRPHLLCLLVYRFHERFLVLQFALILFLFLLRESLLQSLSSEVILDNDKLPPGVSVSYESHCKNDVTGTGENGKKCSNISIGDEVRH